MPLRKPGLRSKFPKLKEEYGVETYGELVMEIEAERVRISKPLMKILSHRTGKITVDAVLAKLRNMGVKAKKKDVSFMLKLRKLYRLPAPGNIVVGPRKDNPILTLLGTYGPLRRHQIVSRINDVDFRDPLELLAEIYDKIVIKNGRSVDKKRLKVLRYVKGSSEHYLVLAREVPEIEYVEYVEKRRIPVVDISKFVDRNTIIVPVERCGVFT